MSVQNVQLNLLEPKNFQQIFQATKIVFAFFNLENNNLNMLNYWALCRDFLGDMLIDYYTKKQIKVWKFDYISIPNLKSLYLGIKFETPNQKETFKNNLNIIHNIESKNKIRKTKIFFEHENILIIKFSPTWTKKAWAFSLYTYLLKVIAITNDFKQLDGPELDYYLETKHKLPKILDNLKHCLRFKSNYSGCSENLFFSNIRIHDDHGFVSQITKNHTENYKYFNTL